MPKILCLYSGGIDSAGALWKLIHDPNYVNYEILVHHVHIINITRRFNAEKISVEKTIPIFKKYTNRRLYLSSTIMDFSFLGNKIPVDADVYGFVAANLVNIDKSVELIAIGRTLDDKNSGGSSLFQLVDCIERALYLCNYSRDSHLNVKCITPVVDMTKAQIWASLPEELRVETWSCRTPKYTKIESGGFIFEPCLKCHACQARGLINDKLEY